ncbi:MAG: hypothetical protein ACJ71Q_17860 [Terriglobales bacterium]
MPQSPSKLVPEALPLYVRVHTRLKQELQRKDKEKPDQPNYRPPQWANFALVFDCETTTDIRQDLTFAWWRFCELKDGIYVAQQEGVIYADALHKSDVGLIRAFARSKRADVEQGCPEKILVQSRSEFVNGEFWEALQAAAVIVCFNAPFDLSRLALQYREAQRKNSGWSMVYWEYNGKPDKFKPMIRIKPKDSRSAFISLAGGDPENRTVYRGRFLDLSVLGWALRNQHMSLEGFLRSFGLKGKLPHEPTGKVTKRELAYGRRDVERTVALLNAMKREYDGFDVDLPPERAMSAASITKAFLDKMAVTPPWQKFSIPDDILGKCMQAYYGGRSEIRIRHQEMPVIVCDTTSEYPSVAVLLNLWRLLIADQVQIEDCTAAVKEILSRINLENALRPDTWRELAFFASLKPNGDLLPVRAPYGEGGETNIGLNPLTCEQPIWYAGPDLAASKIRTGKTPKILRAFRLIPSGIQSGMQTAHIGARTVDPAKDDFFQAVIEERKKLPKSHPHYLLLKIIANALYGIFAELNKEEFGKNKAKIIEVFSGDAQHEEPKTVIERPGKWQFAPAAALITAAGRLMLMLLECMAEKRGGSYLLTDTDSMFFVASQSGGLIPCPGGPHAMPDGSPAVQAMRWSEVEHIANALNRLNPYDPNTINEILKIEECNFDRHGQPHELRGLAVSAKRYVAYKRSKRKLMVIKPSEHGLGIIFIPDKRPRYKPRDCNDEKTDYPLWVVEVWERLLERYMLSERGHDIPLVARKLWFEELPAMMRIRVTTPNVLKALRMREPGSAKPYNFAQSPILVNAPDGFTLVAPFNKNSETWITTDYTEIHSGDTVRLFNEYDGTEVTPQTISGVMWRHFLHPEDKSLGPDGQPCGPYTKGLLRRRPVQAITPFVLIGKEIDRKAQEGEDISVLESTGPLRYHAGRKNTRAADPEIIGRARRFSIRQLMRESGKNQHAVERFLRSEPVHPETRVQIEAAVERLDGKK